MEVWGQARSGWLGSRQTHHAGEQYADAVTHLAAVCNIHLLPALLELGWSVVPLGLPVEDKGQVCIAILIEATTQMTRSIREAGLLPLRPGGGTSH